MVSCPLNSVYVPGADDCGIRGNSHNVPWERAGTHRTEQRQLIISRHNTQYFGRKDDLVTVSATKLYLDLVHR